jgi:hypothetical protein
MRYRVLCALIAFSLIATATSRLFAHHSFAAEYDAKKPVTLKGVVTKMEWANPHIYFYVDVKDQATGQVNNWAVEGGRPGALFRLGWTRDSLKVGDQVTVEGSLARNGTNRANMRTVVLANGQRVFGASSENTLER